MAELIVQEWLTEFRRLQSEADDKLDAYTLDETFANEHNNDFEIAEAIFRVFHDHREHPTLIHDICQQLLAFYRCSSSDKLNSNNSNSFGTQKATSDTPNSSSCSTLQRFSLQFIPVLIYLYLHAVACGEKNNVRSLETLLICMYNGEVSTIDGDYKVLQFRMPILAQTSIYHEEKNLPMTDLRRWEENCNREVKWGPHYRIETITAQNRLRVMTVLLFCYNQEIYQTQKSALIHLCRVSSQMVNDGFLRTAQHSHRISYGSDSSLMTKALRPRIPLNSSFLLELVHAVYYAMFNDFATIAIQALEDIHRRASFEMYTDVILVTNAVRNSLSTNVSGQPNDGPMGLNIAPIPSSNAVTATVSKFMITNASFRTKKLPDDIPIQAQDASGTQQNLTQPFLSSVSEETSEQTAAISIRDQQQQQQSGQSKDSKDAKDSSQRNSLIRPSMEGIKAQAHKALIAGFKKAKDKDKDKDKEKEKEKEREKDSANRNSSIINNNSDSNQLHKNQRKSFDKHSQRNSLIQLPLTVENQATMADGYEKSPGPHKSKGYSINETSYENNIELLPISNKLSVMDSTDAAIMENVNDSIGSGCGGAGVIGLNVGDNAGRISGGGNLINSSNNTSNSMVTTISLASNELLTTTKNSLELSSSPKD